MTSKNQNELEQRYINAELVKRKRKEALENARNCLVNKPPSKSTKRESLEKLKVQKQEEYIKKKENFKKIKQMETDIQNKRKNIEVERHIKVQKNILEKFEKFEADHKETQNKINEYENEEIQILKRMQKSTVMLASSKLILLLIF